MKSQPEMVFINEVNRFFHLQSCTASKVLSKHPDGTDMNKLNITVIRLLWTVGQHESSPKGTSKCSEHPLVAGETTNPPNKNTQLSVKEGRNLIPPDSITQSLVHTHEWHHQHVLHKCCTRIQIILASSVYSGRKWGRGSIFIKDSK